MFISLSNTCNSLWFIFYRNIKLGDHKLEKKPILYSIYRLSLFLLNYYKKGYAYVIELHPCTLILKNIRSTKVPSESYGNVFDSIYPVSHYPEYLLLSFQSLDSSGTKISFAPENLCLEGYTFFLYAILKFPTAHYRTQTWV